MTTPELAGLPSAPPPHGGPWRWENPRGRGSVLVPGIPEGGTEVLVVSCRS
jgi:hypothetical protein